MGSTSNINNDSSTYCYRRNQSQVLQLVNNLGKLFTDRNLFDCSIICEGNQVIRGHKLMLSASSDYFKTAFNSFGGNSDGDNNLISHSCSNTAIIIREIPYDDLKLIIDYIYSGEMIIPSGQLSSIQKSCQWLKVNCLPLKETLIPIKSVNKVNSSSCNANCASSRIKSDATTSTIKVNCGRLSINNDNNSKSLTNGHHHHGNVNVINSLKRVPSLSFPFRSSNNQQLIKIVDPSTDCGLKGFKASSSSITPTSSSSSSSSSSLNLKIISSPNETRKVNLNSSSTGESFVQLRELLRRDPDPYSDTGNEKTGNRNDEMMISNQENGEIENEFDQNRVDQMKHDNGNDEDDNDRMDDREEGKEMESKKMMTMEDDKQEELIFEEGEEEVGGERGVIIEEDADEDEEEVEEDEKFIMIEGNDNNNGQGQEVDNTDYLSSEEFEIDIPRSNEHHHQPYHPHQKRDMTEENKVMTTNEVEIEDEDEDEDEEEEIEERVMMRDEQGIESGGEPEDEEDEVIDMRVNSGRRFDHHSHLGHHHSYLPGHHHSLAAFQGQNLEAAAAAVAAVAAVAASSGSTSGTSNIMDECPSGDSLDLDCGDKLRATNYSMIPFTASIASSFSSATARAIAASTTLAVASGLLSKSQQLQNHSSSSSPSSSTTTTTTTTPGINGTHQNNLTNGSSHQLHPHHLNHHHQQQHQHHSHEILYKKTSSNSDSHSDISTIPLKRGRGRPPRHLRDTPINGSSSSSLTNNSNSLEPFRTYKVRNILPSATTSDLILQHSANNNNNNNNKVNNQLNGETNNHHHLILSTSSNLGLTLKRKIRLNNNGLIGLVTGGGSTKGRKPKMSQSNDCSNNNGKNVCPYCPQVYYSNQAMNDHINNVHTGNSRKYTCDLCSKEFSWKISLTKHLRNSHKPDKLTEQLTTNNLIDSRQQQLTLTNM